MTHQVDSVIQPLKNWAWSQREADAIVHRLNPSGLQYFLIFPRWPRLQYFPDFSIFLQYFLIDSVLELKNGHQQIRLSFIRLFNLMRGSAVLGSGKISSLTCKWWSRCYGQRHQKEPHSKRASPLFFTNSVQHQSTLATAELAPSKKPNVMK